ncbi:ciliary neurotrophic factor [Pelodytes ibericus]
MDAESLVQEDPFSLVIQQLRKIRVDLVPLTEKYVQVQGFDNFDMPRESASMEVGDWAEMAPEERLLANLTAFLTLERQLQRVVEDQKELLHPRENFLHGGLRTLLGQVAALREQLEEIAVSLGMLKEWSSDIDEVEGEESSIFERKVRGYRVLRELSVWAVRSVRDLRKLKREREKYVRESVREAEALMDRVESKVGRE